MSFPVADKARKISPVVQNNRAGKPFFQPKLAVSQPGDVHEQQADAVADKVVNGQPAFFSPVQKTGNNNVQRQEETPPKKEEASVGFIDTGEIVKTFDELILQLPDRYKDAYAYYKKTHATFIFDLTESRKLASDQIMAMWNLSYAIVYSKTSPYKNLGFGDSVKMAESLSGVSDTYINLASLALHKDLKKFISDKVPDLVIKNLGIILLTGIALQAGIAGIQYAVGKEADFVSIINPFVGSFTEMPGGLKRPFSIDNIPDPRWKSPFLNPSPGIDFNWSGNNPDAKAPSLNFNLGLNFPSILSLYPKNEEEKKKYKGFELYPFFNFSRNYAKEGQPEPEQKDKYFAGVFVGNKGIYTLVEGGAITGPLGVMEAYGRGGLVLKNMGSLKLFQLDAELDYRKDTDSLRTRINSATEIQILDNKQWQFTVGGMVGGLVPSGDAKGSFDYGANLTLYNKQYSADQKDTYRTGIDIGFTNRLQDPFAENSLQLFSLQTKLVFYDMIKVGFQYDKVSGQAAPNVFTPIAPDANLPGSSVTVFGAFDFAPLLFRDENKKK
ncbi:hypothetical protein [Foetidibacter luteolus]|uniref:hypothetical protein n=1 Tax=Foetidibacter luteolus TaxID=2608880 RepID=UPI00129A3772|nr:hypothetical protein [Foetidibacter luteolus]